MKRWDLHTLAPSSEKQVAREPGADAPRVPSTGRQMPRVLFSSPECRAVVIDLRATEELGDHHVRQRAVVEVVAGRVSIDSGGESVECAAGTLLTFEPGEHHAVRAQEDARLLLVLAPWSVTAQDGATEQPGAGSEHVPANAVADPIGSEADPAARP